jgi:hypothetical protein
VQVGSLWLQEQLIKALLPLPGGGTIATALLLMLAPRLLRRLRALLAGGGGLGGAAAAGAGARAGGGAPRWRLGAEKAHELVGCFLELDGILESSLLGKLLLLPGGEKQQECKDDSRHGTAGD